MKNKLIKPIPWSVALLFFCMSVFYNTLWERSIKRNDEYHAMVDTCLSSIREYKHKYDSVVEITHFLFEDSGPAIVTVDDSAMYDMFSDTGRNASSKGRKRTNGDDSVTHRFGTWNKVGHLNNTALGGDVGGGAPPNYGTGSNTPFGFGSKFDTVTININDGYNIPMGYVADSNLIKMPTAIRKMYEYYFKRRDSIKGKSN